MTHALVLLMALLIGVIAGLRSLTAPAVVAWAAYLGWIDLHGTWASWMGSPTNVITAVIFSVLAVGELVNDKLPKTPPRTAPPIFAARIVMGGLAGAVIGAAWHWTFTALGAGVIGAVLGTLGGYQARKRLVAVTGGKDLPIALLEDAVAILGAFAILALTAHIVTVH